MGDTTFPTHTSLLNSRIVCPTASFTPEPHVANRAPDYSLHLRPPQPSYLRWWHLLPGCELHPDPSRGHCSLLSTQQAVVPLKYGRAGRSEWKFAAPAHCPHVPADLGIFTSLVFCCFSHWASLLFLLCRGIELCTPKTLVELSTAQYLRMRLSLEIGLYSM